MTIMVRKFSIRSGFRSAATAVLCAIFLSTSAGCLRLEESDFDATAFPGLIWPLLFGRSSFALGQLDTNSVQGLRLGMQSPYKLSIAGGRLFVVDSQNRRILGYNSLPLTNQSAPDFALGQPDIHTTLVAAVSYDINADYVNRGRGVYTDGTRVFVVDNLGHRVLIWNSIPTTSLTSANVVIGQPNFTSSTMGTSATLMNSPEGVAVCGSKLFVADSGNNRVLGYNSIPTVNGQAADFALGQVDLVSAGTGNAAQAMNSPRGVFCDGTKLYVADSTNSRVVIFNTLPTASNTLADVVVGQTNFGVGGTGNAANQMNGPEDVQVSGSRMYVADTSNHRVLYFNSIPTVNNANADGVIGQPGFGSAIPNNPDALSGLQDPRGIASDGTNLFIADTSNNRVVVHTTPAPANGAAHNIVLGQPGLGTITANNISPTAILYNGVGGTLDIDGRLYVAAADDNRILGYNSVPTSSGAAADFVLGQSDLTSDTSGTSQTSFNGASTLCAVGSTLYVVDLQNSRILGYNSIPVTTNPAADFVIGQNDFTSNMQNKGASPTADSLATPTSVHCDTQRLIVTDASNNRILIYEPPPTTTNPSASIVIGQANFTTATTGTTQTTFNGPRAATVDDSGRLLVSDVNNHRILIFNSIPTGNGAAADLVLGQPDFTSAMANGGASVPDARGMNFPNATLVLNGNLLVSDVFNNRILIWNSFPTTNYQAADRVFGQGSFNESRPNLGGISASVLSGPFAMDYHNGFIYIADAFNQRILGVLAGDMGLTGL